MMEMLKGKSPKKQTDQIEKLVYAVKMDQQLLPSFLHSKFRVGGEKTLRRIEVCDDPRLREDASRQNLENNDQCINLNIKNEKKIIEPVPDKSEFMRRGKKFIQALEEASLKTKSKPLNLPRLEKKAKVNQEEKVKCLFMPYYNSKNPSLSEELDAKMYKYHQMLKNQNSIPKEKGSLVVLL
jgi:hypothetical protein